MAVILPFGGVEPRIHPTAFVAPSAVVVGNVEIGPESSVWFGAVLRGDNPNHGIVVGPRTSIQDHCMVHVGDWGPTVVGADVTMGHGAKIESCRVGDRTVIGMNAVVLQNADVGEECLLAAGTVVLEGVEIPRRSLVAGVPGRVKKTLEGNAARWIEGGGEHYVALSRSYLRQGIGDGRGADADGPSEG